MELKSFNDETSIYVQSRYLKDLFVGGNRCETTLQKMASHLQEK